GEVHHHQERARPQLQGVRARARAAGLEALPVGEGHDPQIQAQGRGSRHQIGGRPRRARCDPRLPHAVGVKCNPFDWLGITFARRRPRVRGDPYSRGGGYGSPLSRGRQYVHMSWIRYEKPLAHLLGATDIEGGCPRMRDKTRIAIAAGDPAGIGPEISLKAALDPAVRNACNPIVVGDAGVLERHAAACRIAAELRVVARAADADWSGYAINVLG